MPIVAAHCQPHLKFLKFTYFISVSLDQRLFYCDEVTDRIASIDLTTNTPTPITLFQADGDQTFFAIGVYGNVVYWADWELTTLVRSNKYDSSQREFIPIGVNKDLIRPSYIHIYQGKCNYVESPDDLYTTEISEIYKSVGIG